MKTCRAFVSLWTRRRVALAAWGDPRIRALPAGRGRGHPRSVAEALALCAALGRAGPGDLCAADAGVSSREAAMRFFRPFARGLLRRVGRGLYAPTPAGRARLRELLKAEAVSAVGGP